MTREFRCRGAVLASVVGHELAAGVDVSYFERDIEAISGIAGRIPGMVIGVLMSESSPDFGSFEKFKDLAKGPCLAPYARLTRETCRSPN
jgi:hypothetical protein